MMHGNLLPVFVSMDFIAEDPSDGVMAFLENICGDFKAFSDNAFDRITSTIKFWFDLFNHDRL